MRKVRQERPATAVAEALGAPSEMVAEARSYEFLTPVFGGGVRIDGARKHADPRTPVRGAAIRGQLRFWWRAVNPRGCATVDALREAEAAVFGIAGVASQGVLELAVVAQPQAPRALEVLVRGDKFKSHDAMREIAYGAFPLRDDKEAAHHGVLHEYRGPWTLALRYHRAIKDDVEAALWAWAHFGGLGGRTRRGFGAVRQTAGAALPSVADGWQRWIVGPAGRPASPPWPHLRVNRDQWLAIAGDRYATGLEAQKRLLGALQKLRQGPLGRNPTSSREPKRPGRSYWPEPDALRAVRKTASVDHRERVTTADAFPRAAFGMPIVFHFKDRGDPTDSLLRPRVGGAMQERLASPLILRPHATADGKVEALALVLGHPAPSGLTLTGPENLRMALTEAEARAIRPLSANGTPFQDPLLRYLHLLRTGQ